MSNTTTRSQKHSYLFVFNRPEHASMFLSMINNKGSGKYFAQHPYDNTKRCALDTKKVLVTGSDLNLVSEEFLLKQAEKHGGIYFPITD